VARISGKTVIMPAVLPGRHMHGFNAYITEPIEVSPTAHALDELNRHLRQDWLDAVGLASPLEQHADALRGQAGQTSRLAILKAQGLVATAYDELGSALQTTALLEAALHRADASVAASAWHSDALNAWAERSFAQRERDALAQNATLARDLPVRVSDGESVSDRDSLQSFVRDMALPVGAVAPDTPRAPSGPLAKDLDVQRGQAVPSELEASSPEQASDDAAWAAELAALEQSLLSIAQQEGVDV